MANRGGRAALERLQARMTEEVTVEDEAEPVAVSLDGEQPDGEGDNEPDGGGGVIDDPVDDGPSIDYSHAGDDDGEAEPDPEPEPRDRSDRRPAANDDAVEALAAQLAELRGEIAANKQAEAAEAQLVGDLQHVRRAAGLSQRNLQEAQAAYAKHAAAGEWGKAAQAQADMAAAVADLREYQAAEAELVQEMRQPKRQPAAPAQQQLQQQADAFEQAISKFSAPQQEWLRKNRDDLTKSESRGKKAEAAHFEAIEAGHKLNSPAYFAHLDKVMGYGVTTTKTTKPAPGKPQRAAPTAGGSSAARGSVTEVKLSRDEVNTAKQLGMTAKAYAAQKARLIENGRDPSKSGPRYSRESHHVRR